MWLAGEFWLVKVRLPLLLECVKLVDRVVGESLETLRARLVEVAWILYHPYLHAVLLVALVTSSLFDFFMLMLT